MYLAHNDGSRGAKVGPISHTSHIWETGWGVTPRSGYCPPSSGGLNYSTGCSRSAITPGSRKRGIYTVMCSSVNWHQTPVGFFCMTDQQPVTVGLWFHTMHPPSMQRHWTRGKFYSAVRAVDPPSRPLILRFSPDHAPPSHRLLQHPRPDCARLATHGPSFCDIHYQ